MRDERPGSEMEMRIIIIRTHNALLISISRWSLMLSLMWAVLSEVTLCEHRDMGHVTRYTLRDTASGPGALLRLG